MPTLEQALATEIALEDILQVEAQRGLAAATAFEAGAREASDRIHADINLLEVEIAHLRAPGSPPPGAGVIESKVQELSAARALWLIQQTQITRAEEGKVRMATLVAFTRERLSDLAVRRVLAETAGRQREALTVALLTPPITATEIAGLEAQLDARENALNTLITQPLVDLARERRRLEDIRRENAFAVRDHSIDLRNAAAARRFGLERASALVETIYDRKQAQIESFLAHAQASIGRVEAVLLEPLPVISDAVARLLERLYKNDDHIYTDAALKALRLIAEEIVLAAQRLRLEQFRLTQLVAPDTPTGSELTDRDAVLASRDACAAAFAAVKEDMFVYDHALPEPVCDYLRHLGDAREIVDRLKSTNSIALASELAAADAAWADTVTIGAATHRTYEQLEGEVRALETRAHSAELAHVARARAAARGDNRVLLDLDW